MLVNNCQLSQNPEVKPSGMYVLEIGEILAITFTT